MLSIAKMGKASESYYTKLAREDYYLSGGEPPGLWAGRGAARLGLRETVETKAFRNLFQGFSADGSVKLAQNAGTDLRHPGWDLTFSAPKSVSVLWSQEGPARRKLIEECVVRATRDTLTYLEDTAVFTRRGRAGATIERGEGAVAALFLHGTSRAQEPQLHVHATLFNLVAREDGTWGTMLGITSSDRKGEQVRNRSALYQEKMTAGALFRASLAAQLESVAGLTIERSKDGFEVAGVSRELMERFSTRRHEIQEELRSLGQSGAKDSERAALRTRTRKALVSREELFRRWGEQARGLEMPTRRESNLAPAPSLALVLEAATRDASARRFDFGESDLLRSLADRSIGLALDAQTLRRAAHDHLGSLVEKKGFPGRFISPEALSQRRSLIAVIEKMSRKKGAAPVPGRVLKRVVGEMATRNDVLPAAVTAKAAEVLGSSRRLRSLTGLPQRDSFYALTAASIAWEDRGLRVAAVSSTTRTARGHQALTGIRTWTLEELHKDTRPKTHAETFRIVREAGTKRGIQFGSLMSFLKYAEMVKRSPRLPLEAGTVLVVDRPDRFQPQALEHLLRRANSAGATVVFSHAVSEYASELRALTRDQRRGTIARRHDQDLERSL
ncbi:MAG TPA: MobF family relaxase [Candidatus Nitrosotalea sp.]|nr:MobF family relaxase [Candidatus Nitrosotalea sp.]